MVLGLALDAPGAHQGVVFCGLDNTAGQGDLRGAVPLVAVPGEAALPRQLDLVELVVGVAVGQGLAFGGGAGL